MGCGRPARPLPGHPHQPTRVRIPGFADHIPGLQEILVGKWQGRGIATEAARGMVGWLGRRGVRTLVAQVHPDHRASAAAATACGLAPTDVWQDGEVRWTGPAAPPHPRRS